MLPPFSALLSIVCSADPSRADSPATTTPSKTNQFQQLTTSSGLEGWKHDGNWTFEDGVITRSEEGGNLVYVKSMLPDDFELRFDWKVGQGSNSGVYYRPGQYEYQVLDNVKHRDGANPRTSAASLYFCMAPTHDATRPVGEWNNARIVCKGSVIQHWLNGKPVIDMDYTDPKWAFNVDLLKRRGGELSARGGQLWLQDHGDPVWYRSIQLREIPAEETLNRHDLTPAEIPKEILVKEKAKLDGIIQRREASKKAANR